MKTLRQLDDAILDASKARAKELTSSISADIMSENEIVAVQANMRYGEKYREMYNLLVEVEKHFNQDFNYETGEWDRQTAVKIFQEKLKNI